jgi:putative hydrolase of the HAD superfamily
MIIFDADETLFDFSKSEKVALEKAMKDNDLEYDESYHLPLYKDINIKIWKEFEEGKITQKELKVDRFQRFLDRLGERRDAHLFADYFMSHLAEASYLFDGVVELIVELSKKYRLVIVTNGLTRVQKHRVRESEIAHYFERIIISEEIGYKKPDPLIFVEGLKGLEPVDKSEMIIVGDSLTSDIPGGINFGIDTVWYNPSGKENTSGLKPTYEISNLKQLKEIF